MLRIENIRDNMPLLNNVINVNFGEWGKLYSASPVEAISNIKNAIYAQKPFPQIYALLDDDKFLGSFEIDEFYLPDCPLTPWLSWFVIEQSERNKGYGREMLKFAKKIILQNYNTIYACTTLSNFYEKIGFKYLKDVMFHKETQKLFVFSKEGYDYERY